MDFFKTLDAGFIVGLIMLALNIPIGWIGMTWLVAKGKKENNKLFYFMGILIYILSWGMWFLGIYLCGKEFVDMLMGRYRVYVIIFTALLIIGCLIYFYKKFHKKTDKKNTKKIVKKIPKTSIDKKRLKR